MATEMVDSSRAKQTIYTLKQHGTCGDTTKYPNDNNIENGVQISQTDRIQTQTTKLNTETNKYTENIINSESEVETITENSETPRYNTVLYTLINNDDSQETSDETQQCVEDNSDYTDQRSQESDSNTHQ